jgi:hypothetical protein
METLRFRISAAVRYIPRAEIIGRSQPLRELRLRTAGNKRAMSSQSGPSVRLDFCLSAENYMLGTIH